MIEPERRKEKNEIGKTFPQRENEDGQPGLETDEKKMMMRTKRKQQEWREREDR